MQSEYVECDQFQNRSTCIEVRHKVLVKQSKDESCRVMPMKQEEEHFEVDKKKKKMNNENNLDTKEEHFDECMLESVSDDEIDFSRSMLNG